MLMVLALAHHGLAMADEPHYLGEKADLGLTVAETSEIASKPLFSKRLGRVSFDKGHVCVNCGDLADLNDMGQEHVVRRLDSGYLAFLKKTVRASDIFPEEVRERIALSATLTGLRQESSVGGRAEKDNKWTSGATLTTTVSIHYELVDDDTTVGSWDIRTVARSNSLGPHSRLSESMDMALERNVRALLLKMIADYSPSDSARANAALASLEGEADNTRSVLGYLVYGVGKTVAATAGVVGDGLSAVVQNSGAISAGLNQAASQMNQNTRDLNEAYTRSVLARRNQITGPPVGSGADDSGSSDDASRPVRHRDDEAADHKEASAKGSSGAEPAAAKGKTDDTGKGRQDEAARRPATRAADNASARTAAAVGGADAASTARKSAPKRVEWTPVLPEAVAACTLNEKSQRWSCDGPFQGTSMADYTLMEALALSGCKFPTSAGSNTTNAGKPVEVYRCGYGMTHSDRDVRARLGLIVSPREYMCHKDAIDACTTPYTGQDLRSD